MKRPCVYVARNESGDILYIGMTLVFRSRIDAHGCYSAWFDQCRTVDIVHCETKRAAANLEKSMILEFRPPFNVAYLVPPKRTKIACAFVKKKIAYAIFRSHVSAVLGRSGGNIDDDHLRQIVNGDSPYYRRSDDYRHACKVLCLPLSENEYFGLFK